MPDIGQLMQNPRMVQMLQAMAQGKGRQGMDRMKGPSNALSNLADAYPKLKAQSEQMKIQEAERKVKKMKFDSILKQAEQQYKLREQQRQMAQGQQQIEAARRSV